MEITFWGVRGSIPSPGAEFNRYGGNTPCVSVRTAADDLIILDAGTGITLLGQALQGTAFTEGRGEATLLLSHAHWDHIQGFPFFVPVFIHGNRLAIYGPSTSSAMVEGILEGQMDPHFSPVHSLRNLGATIELRAITDQTRLSFSGVDVSTVAVPHGRHDALAYRLQEGEGSLVYVPDAGYGPDGPKPEVLALFDHATYLIHDCNYTPEEQKARRSRGHSSVAEAAKAAAAAQVGTLVMFHYDQDYTDADVDRLAARCRELLDAEPNGTAVRLIAAHEGLKLTV